MAVRDVGLLGSALYRPRQEVFGVETYPDLFEKAAAITAELRTSRVT